MTNVKHRHTQPTERLHIEQAVAMGRSLDWIIEHLGATPVQVDETLRYLDKINAEDDHERPTEPTPPPPTGHGTHNGYNRHRKAHEAACRPCLKAESEYSFQRRLARRRKAA